MSDIMEILGYVALVALMFWFAKRLKPAKEHRNVETGQTIKEVEPPFSWARVIFLLTALCIAFPFVFVVARPAWSGIKTAWLILYTAQGGQ